MSRPIMRFSAPPQTGSQVVIGKQVYDLVKITPHIRLDGQATSILHWRSHCQTCGGHFEVTTGLTFQYMNRNCPQHHAPGRRGRFYRKGGAK